MAVTCSVDSGAGVFSEPCQASRLIKESNGKKISAKTLNLLKSEDFNANAGMYAKDDKKIGFCS